MLRHLLRHDYAISHYERRFRDEMPALLQPMPLLIATDTSLMMSDEPAAILRASSAFAAAISAARALPMSPSP